MMMKTICKVMRKRQKHFPWLKTFIKEYLVKYPKCKKMLQYLVENIEKEVDELKNGHKQKTRTLFETVNDLSLHFWWKIRWKKKSHWENYWNADCTHLYHSSENIKCFGKLLKFLIYLGIVLSHGVPNSLWINRVLQVINILPVGDEIVYDALLGLRSLKKKHRNSYIEILRHILCSEIILNLSEPAVYIKSLLLFRRLKNFTEDEVAKASLITTASKIKSPSKLASWLSSFDISISADKSLVDQLFTKNSKEVFQKLHHVLVGSETGENSKLKNKQMNSKLEKKLENKEKDNAKEEKKLHRMSIGFTNTLNKKSLQKKTLAPQKLSNKIKNSKKKVLNATDDNLSINLVTDENIVKSKQKAKNTKKNSKNNNLVKRTLNSQNTSKRCKQFKEKKSKAENNVIDVSKSENTCKNAGSGSKNKKSKKKKDKEADNNINVSPGNERNDLLDSQTCSYLTNFINKDSVVNNKSHIECLPGSNQTFNDANCSILSKNNENGTSKNEENCVIKEGKLGNSMLENQKTQISTLVENASSNNNDLANKLPNLLANYEILSADERDATKKDVSSCPVVETNTVLVPDTCQNGIDSLAPFNLDFWEPEDDDASQNTSVSKDCSQISSQFPYVSVTDIRKTSLCQNWQSDYSNSSFYDSAVENAFDGETSRDISEMSRDSFVSSEASQISGKYPFVSLVDIRKTKKKRVYKNKMLNYTDSSFDDPVFGDFNDSEFSRDTCISKDGSQISDKNPYVSLVDVRKSLSPNKKSDCSNSSFNDPVVENINGSEVSQEIKDFNAVPEISTKDSDDIKKVDKMSLHQTNSNLNDPVSENIKNNEIVTDSNMNSSDSLSHKLNLIEKMNEKSQNTLNKSHHETNTNSQGNLKLSSGEICVPSTEYVEKHLSHDKHSKMRIASEKQDFNSINETNASAKAKRSQTSFCVKKQQEKRKHNSSKGNSFVVQPREENCDQDLEKSANDNAYLNELSTLLANHGDVETQEHESISHVANIVLNHSDAQDLSQIQENNTTCGESNILPHDFNDNQTPSHSFNPNIEKQACSTLPIENRRDNINNCLIETVLEEFIESELSKEHNSSDNVNSTRSSGGRSETYAGSVDHVDNNTFDSFQNRPNLVPAVNFSSGSSVSTPQQNNQSATFSASSSSITANRYLENEVAGSLLNMGINENPQRNVFSTNPNHGNVATNSDNINLNSNFVVDCNIINDFDSRNSSAENSSVSRDTPTIKIVLNLINAKPENCSQNSDIPYSSHCLLPSLASSQTTNHASCSLPVQRNNSYFSEPPFIRRIVNELETPPDSESHMRIARSTRRSSSCNDQTNFASLSKGRSSTPKSLSKKRHQNEFSHSSENTNEWQMNQYDFNSSFSNIPSFQNEHSEAAPNSWNVHERGHNSNYVQNDQNQEPLSRIVEQSASTGRNAACVKSKPKVSYRNSISNIYSDESVDDLSVSTMSLLSGEETDYSLLNTTDAEISPVLRSRRQNIDASKTTVKKVFRRKQASDSLTAESSTDEKRTVNKRKRKQKHVVKSAKKPKTTLNSAYNLRSRHLLTPPTKLNSYHV